MQVKICGITKVDQGQAIIQLGATALGFICVPNSPRYISIDAIKVIVQQIPKNIETIGVFANASLADIDQTVAITGLTGVQLHGEESIEFCQQIKKLLPKIKIIKAIRVKNQEILQQAKIYANYVNTLLLDAYHPTKQGGTGQTLDWTTLSLREFNPGLPWLLSGGLNPDNVAVALDQIMPKLSDRNLINSCIGIDLSSGVERSAGDKDLEKVTKLFTNIAPYL